MASEAVILDFGAHPGSGHAKVVVIGQTDFLTTSRLEAWLEPADTADHTHDEHIVVPMIVRAGNKVAGVGFTVHGVMFDFGGSSEDRTGRGAYTKSGRTGRRTWGRWSCAWAWT